MRPTPGRPQAVPRHRWPRAGCDPGGQQGCLWWAVCPHWGFPGLQERLSPAPTHAGSPPPPQLGGLSLPPVLARAPSRAAQTGPSARRSVHFPSVPPSALPAPPCSSLRSPLPRSGGGREGPRQEQPRGHLRCLGCWGSPALSEPGFPLQGQGAGGEGPALAGSPLLGPPGRRPGAGIPSPAASGGSEYDTRPRARGRGVRRRGKRPRPES